MKQWQSVYRSQAFFSAAVVVAITIGSLPGVSPLPTPRGTTSVRQVAAAVATLPFPPNNHRDPFDRLIVAQAIVEGMGLVSADSRLDAYGITRIW